MEIVYSGIRSYNSIRDVYLNKKMNLRTVVTEFTSNEIRNT